MSSRHTAEMRNFKILTEIYVIRQTKNTETRDKLKVHRIV